MKFSFISFTIISLFLLSDCSEFNYSVILSTEKELLLEWNMDYPPKTVDFRVKGKLKRNEWLAFGFSDYGQTENADLVLYWNDDLGETYFKVKLIFLVFIMLFEVKDFICRKCIVSILICPSL